MRRVKYFEMQRINHEESGSLFGEERVEMGEAWFHGWGVNLGHSAAIIELDDGTVKYPTADMIQFIEPTTQPKE